MDLNLLRGLDALLREGSVGGAAKRLNLSSPAMSRTLERIRHTLQDPILVGAGRAMVLTERALEMRGAVYETLARASALLEPRKTADLSSLVRVMTVRTNDAFIATFGARCVDAVLDVAPHITLHFLAEGTEEVGPLRDGPVDLEFSILKPSGPEIRVRALFNNPFIGVVRADHRLTEGEITPERFAAEQHISSSRRGVAHGPIDDELAKLGLQRRVPVIVPTMTGAVALAHAGDLVAAVPLFSVGALQHDMFVFPIPLPSKPNVLTMTWHPRVDRDPAHRTIRDLLRRCCTSEAMKIARCERFPWARALVGRIDA